MLIISHPTGNENVRQAVRAFNDAGLLAKFVTSVCWDGEHAVNRVLPQSATRELARRSFPHLRRDQLQCYPWREMGRLLARRFGCSHLIRHEAGPFSMDAVYQSLDRKVAAQLPSMVTVNAVYAYEDGALATFREAQRLGMTRTYDLPIGHWRCYRELLEEEAALQPEWRLTLSGAGDSAAKLERKDEELQLATDVIVASQFVRRTLSKAGKLSARIRVIPYGAPPTAALEKKPRTGGVKLRVIFVGALSQRKGISYLLEAVKSLQSGVELTLIGLRVGECHALDAALKVHRWIPSLPHNAILQEMSQHDVLVFPSLFEGFGLVLLEAMSQGLPVIATPHTGAPDFIHDGDDGFIVPIRDARTIAEKLDLLRDRDRLWAMSKAALSTARQQTWRRYRSQLVSPVQQALPSHSPRQSLVAAASKLEACPRC